MKGVKRSTVEHLPPPTATRCTPRPARPAQGAPGALPLSVPPGYMAPAYLQQYAAAQGQAEALRRFWAEMQEEVNKAGTDPLEFKNQALPLARIKKASGGRGSRGQNVGGREAAGVREPRAGRASRAALWRPTGCVRCCACCGASLAHADHEVG